MTNKPKEMSWPHLTFPNESAQYRQARNKLLAEEIALRSQIGRRSECALGLVDMTPEGRGQFKPKLAY